MTRRKRQKRQNRQKRRSSLVVTWPVKRTLLCCVRNFQLKRTIFGVCEAWANGGEGGSSSKHYGSQLFLPDESVYWENYENLDLCRNLEMPVLGFIDDFFVTNVNFRSQGVLKCSFLKLKQFYSIDHFSLKKSVQVAKLCLWVEWPDCRWDLNLASI